MSDIVDPTEAAARKRALSQANSAEAPPSMRERLAMRAAQEAWDGNEPLPGWASWEGADEGFTEDWRRIVDVVLVELEEQSELLRADYYSAFIINWCDALRQIRQGKI